MNAQPAAGWRLMLPREHGGWGLLLLPFAAGAALAPLPPRLLAPALGLLVAGFALRAPLLHLARATARGAPLRAQRLALAWAAAESFAAATCLFALWPRLSALWRAGLAVGGPAFTVLAVWVASSNQQRSRIFQTASAAVMALSAPLALHLARGHVPAWGWALWLVFALHAAVAIQLVHQRLERRVAARQQPFPAAAGSLPFFAAVAVQTTAALALGAAEPRWALAPLFSSVYALAEWRTLHRKENLREPLQRVGWRTLALSALHILIAVGAFWPAASQS